LAETQFWLVLKDGKLLGENFKRVRPQILTGFYIRTSGPINWFILLLKCFVSTAYILMPDTSRNKAYRRIKQKVASLWKY
jgi:hypothetical protein